MRNQGGKGMYYYHLYGCLLEADFEFPQLVPVEQPQESPDIVFVSGEMPDELLKKEKLNIFYEFGDSLSWLSNKTCFLVIENGKRISYYLKPGGNVNYLRSYLLGFGTSMLFLQRGEMAIHCSALHNGKEAILITGESGAGKSTLTNFLLQEGWKLMADDMAVLKNKDTKDVLVYPAFPYQKLCRDAVIEKGYNISELIYINDMKDKFLVPYSQEFDLGPKPLAKMIMLAVGNTEKIVVEEVNGINKFGLCVNNLFLRKLLRERRYEPKIGQKCLEIAANTEMLFVGRPAVGNTVEQIKKHVYEFVTK